MPFSTKQVMAFYRRLMLLNMGSPAATLAAIAPSELSVSYEAGAPGYWRIHRTLGQNTKPVIVEASIETRLSRMQMHACPPGRGSLARSAGRRSLPL